MVLLKRAICLLFVIIGLTSCATASRIYPPVPEETGALRVAEVMQFAQRQQIVSSGIHYERILASGIRDADLRDRSLAVGRVYCCGGPAETRNAPFFYIPNDVSVELGDIVEIRMGRQPDQNDPGLVNTVVRVRHKGIAQSPCRWVPEREGLWMRVLYCDWMEKEGWVERGGMWKTWLRPVP